MSKEYPIGLAYHQWPKQGNYRRFVKAPEGSYYIIADVDSQETKLMACESKDSVLLDIYANCKNPHIVTAAAISGLSYEKIKIGKNSEDDKIEKLYKAGKITNLGKNYRMGHKSFDDKKGAHHSATLYQNAHVQWGLTPSEPEVFTWGSAWESLYSGVIEQQRRYINIAKHKGYAETLAGRRFYIDQWAKWRWQSEASAIMQPIQGTGADMKYLAIAIVRQTHPDLRWFMEMHDEIGYTAKKSESYPECAEDKCWALKKTLDNLPYKQAWDWEPIVPFTWTVSYGQSWGEQTEVKE